MMQQPSKSVETKFQILMRKKDHNVTYNKHRVQLLECWKIHVDVCTSFWGHYLFEENDSLILLQYDVKNSPSFHIIAQMKNTSKIPPLELLCLAGTSSTIQLVGDNNQSISLCHFLFLSSDSGSNFHSSPKTVTAYVIIKYLDSLKIKPE